MSRICTERHGNEGSIGGVGDTPDGQCLKGTMGRQQNRQNGFSRCWMHDVHFYCGVFLLLGRSPLLHDPNSTGSSDPKMFTPPRMRPGFLGHGKVAQPNAKYCASVVAHHNLPNAMSPESQPWNPVTRILPPAVHHARPWCFPCPVCTEGALPRQSCSSASRCFSDKTHSA